MADFEWPWQYNFPPFFTIQPNVDTRKKQMEAWCSLVLNYCRHHKLYNLDVTELQVSPLFNNKDINRKLTPDTLSVLLDELCKKGNLEWKDKNKRQCSIVWRTPEEWGKIIYSWVVDHSMVNTVCTLYELIHDDTADKEFHSLDKGILLKALKILEKEGKAELMIFDDSEGVKFF